MHLVQSDSLNSPDRTRRDLLTTLSIEYERSVVEDGLELLSTTLNSTFSVESPNVEEE